MFAEMRKPGQVVWITQVANLDSESCCRFVRGGIRDEQRLQIVPQLDQAVRASDRQQSFKRSIRSSTCATRRYCRGSFGETSIRAVSYTWYSVPFASLAVCHPDTMLCVVRARLLVDVGGLST